MIASNIAWIVVAVACVDCSFPDYTFVAAGCAGCGESGASDQAGAADTAGERAEAGTNDGMNQNGQTLLGCWATDQRPWQHCVTAGDCAPDRCKREASDLTCRMFRPGSCTGSWPPAGYAGEEF